MTDLTQKSAPALTPNATDLGSSPQRRVTSENRIPMSLPNLKLAVPDMPGYYLYWHLGKNIHWQNGGALKAGYTYVDDEELDIEQKGVANAAAESGSTDLGSRISVVAGGTVSDDDLEPARLYLMKLPMEWHEADMAARTAGNEIIARSLRSGLVGAEGDPDKNKRYMKQGQDLFYPKTRA